MKRILLLTSSNTPEKIRIVDEFTAILNQRGGDEYEIIPAHFEDIALIFGEENNGFLLSSNEKLTDFDLVFFKSYIRNEEIAMAIADVLEIHHIPYICSELKQGLSSTKVSQYSRLARTEFLLPKTVYIHSARLSNNYEKFVDLLGLPFVIKAAGGKGGEANYLIRGKAKYEKTLQDHPSVEFVAQSFVPNDHDLRVIVVGGEVKLVIKRARTDDSTHLNNTSQGASAVLIPIEELSSEIADISRRSAVVMGRDIAGVDIMLETGTNKVYLLEVNASPQLGSGAFVDGKIDVLDQYLRKLLQL